MSRGSVLEDFCLVVTIPTSVTHRESSPPSRGAVVVVDLIDHPDPQAAKAVVRATAVAAGDSPVAVTIGDDALYDVLDGDPVDVVVGTEGRREVIARAAVVVRPSPGGQAVSGLSARFGADVLRSGIPLVTTASDPVSDHVQAAAAGAVVAHDPSAFADAVQTALQGDDTAAAWRLAAASASVALGPGLRTSPFLDIVRRPWRWQYAHAGGYVPLHATPEVAELLAAHEAAIVQSVTAAAEHDHVSRTRDELSMLSSEAARLRRRLEEVEADLAEARADVGRLRGHPAVRLLSVLRRLLRAR